MKDEQVIGVALGVGEVEALAAAQRQPQVLFEVVDLKRRQIEQRRRKSVVLVGGCSFNRRRGLRRRRGFGFRRSPPPRRWRRTLGYDAGNLDGGPPATTALAMPAWPERSPAAMAASCRS
jgi:hypothetical protein